MIEGLGWGSERGFREVQRGGEEVRGRAREREREREVIDDDLREQGRGEEVGLRGEVQGRLRGLSGGGVQVLGA